MTYYKSGDTIETTQGLRGKILSLEWSNGTVSGLTVKPDEEGHNYYKGQPVRISVNSITKHESGKK